MNYTIEFEPIGRRGKCAESSSVLDCARDLGAGLVTICGGQGTCKGCKIRVLQGNFSDPTLNENYLFTPEQLKAGWRLACRTYPRSDCKIYLPPDSMNTQQRMQVESQELAVTPEPAVIFSQVKTQMPSFQDSRSDLARVIEALRQQGIEANTADIDVLRGFSTSIRQWNWEARITLKECEIISISAASLPALGLAVDIGTTKIAVYLLDLASGEIVAAKAVGNPQINYGEDIMSRMRTAMKSDEDAARIRDIVIDAIDQAAANLCQNIKAGPQNILDTVLVCNTAIHHLILGLPVDHLARAPYIPDTSESLNVKARDLGLHFSTGSYVHVLPNIAGFVGADHVAMLLSIGADKINKPTIAIDIGTNTEVSLIDSHSILSTSCASGPAFEGGHISCGMRAAGGAIERLKIIDGKVEFQTIDNLSPVGLCGSGALDAVAEFFKAGVIDETGRIVEGQPGFIKNNDILECLIFHGSNNHPSVTLTQKDVRELQLAKGAIRAGIQILLEEADLKEENIEQIIIAGAFGSYIDVSSAITIGMLPSFPLSRFQQVGNAAGGGAKMALISKKKRLEAVELVKKVRYVELATNPNFNKTFAQAMYLGKFRIARGKRVKI